MLKLNKLLMRKRVSHWLCRTAAYLLVGALLFSSTAVAASPPPGPGKVKEKLMKRGIGRGVNITESNGTHAVGVLTAIRDDSFDVTPKDMSRATTIQYSEVIKVQDNKSTMAKVGKGIGVAAIAFTAAMIIIFAVAFHR